MLSGRAVDDVRSSRVGSMQDRSGPPDRRAEGKREHATSLMLKMAQRLAASARAFDTVVHERTRLAILSSLSAAQDMSFRELKLLLGVTDGNLSVHVRKLENAGFVGVCKGFRGRQPRTTFSLTVAGREALEAYLRHMKALISAIGGVAAGRSRSECGQVELPLPTTMASGL